MQWIDEAGLAEWAQRIDARAHLPDLISDHQRLEWLTALRQWESSARKGMN